MFYYNRYNDLSKFITNTKDLKIENKNEIYISKYYDIVIDLELIEYTKIDKEFICEISKNTCKIDNMIQKYAQYILKENEFNFSLEVIQIESNNKINIMYWGTDVNTEFLVDLEYEKNEFIIKNFNNIKNIPKNWQKNIKIESTIK